MRHRARLLRLLLLALLGCRPGPAVKVELSGVPLEALTLEVRVSLDGVLGPERTVLDLTTLAEPKATPTFALRLPPGLGGRLSVAVAALGPAGCLLALGEGEDVQDGTDRQLSVALEGAGGCVARAPAILGVALARGGEGASCAPLGALRPELLSTAGGELLTVCGWGLLPGARVTIGDEEATEVRWRSPTRLELRTPPRPGRRGPAGLRAANLDGGEAARADLLSQYAGVVRFADPLLQPLDLVAAAVALADVNGDGWLDVVVGTDDSDDVAVLPWSGAGLLPPIYSRYGKIKEPVALVLADLSGDGRPDVAIVSRSDSRLSVLGGRGDGTFPAAARAEYAAVSNPAAMAVGDLDRDGHRDLALVSGDGTLSTLGNAGDGTFPPARRTDSRKFAPVPQLAGLSLVDLNGDGEVDAVTTMPDAVQVLLGGRQGLHPAGPVRRYLLGSVPTFVAVGEVHGGGGPDLVAGFADVPSISVVTNDGQGAFPMEQRRDYAIPAPPEAAALGDWNGDGRLDLAVGSLTSGAPLTLLLNGLHAQDGSYATQDQVPLRPGVAALALAVGDLDQDGLPDLVIAGLGRRVSVLLNRSE